MMFCPKCGSILFPDLEKKGIRCKNCNYKESKSKSMIVKEKINNKDKIKIIDKNIETLPKTQVDCPKCGNNQAYTGLFKLGQAMRLKHSFSGVLNATINGGIIDFYIDIKL